MTAGERLRRRSRIVCGTMAAGGGAFALGVILPSALGLPPWGRWLAAIGLTGFAVAFATGLGAYFSGFRCLACRGNLSSLFLHGIDFGSPRAIRFCPFCGCDLDAIDTD